jgi:nucleotide-binding universal stress UspA family protein
VSRTTTLGDEGTDQGGAIVTSNRIVVGVDGSPGARSALLWAADECRLRRQMLLIVHAPDLVDAAEVRSSAEHALRTLDELGERMLSEHAATASARQPGVVVTTALSHASAADELIELSRDSDLVVVGTHGRGGIVSSILGSVSYRVAAHAHCPVAVVPELHRSRRNEPSPRVVVGMSAAPSGRLAMEFALDEAQRRGATLVAVQAAREPSAGEPVANDDGLLQAALAAAARRYRGVAIEPLIINAEPSDALLEAAQGAQLVVVGCHHSEDRWSTRLGPVPSAILHRSPCPVIVLGERQPVTVGARGDMLSADIS